MIKLELLNQVGIKISKTKFDETSLIKIEKLLLTEIQINTDISKQDVIEVLNFLKSDWQEYKPVLLNWNIQSFLFKNKKYKIFSRLIETERTEELRIFFNKHFSENIENAIQTSIRENNWAQLIDMWNNYPFLFPIYYLENELDKMLEDVFYNIKRKSVPTKFEEHYSVQDNFFFFISKVNPSRYDYETDELLDVIDGQLKESLEKTQKDYIKSVRSAAWYNDNDAVSRSSKVIFVILIVSVVGFSYLMFHKSIVLFNLHFVTVFLFSRIEKWSSYLEKEIIYYDGSISVLQFKLRKGINHIAILFYSSFIFTGLSWLYVIFFK